MDARLIAAVSGSGEGLNVAGLCRQLGISRQSFYKWQARYRVEGLDGLAERSRRPARSPRRVSMQVEEAVVELRKGLAEQGLDAGAATIGWHLGRSGTAPAVSEATIWRILVRRGFVTPSPSKRPKGSMRRFEADWPNERWQADHTSWRLANGTEVQILNIIDDHSRLCVACRAAPTVSSPMLWEAFAAAGARWGYPSSCLTDNGLVFSGKLRGFQVDFEIRLRAAGIVPVTSAPFHPQTCGKVERFQQTVKKWLQARTKDLTSLSLLNSCLDDFATYYNHQRPHRGIGRAIPYSRWAANPPVGPAHQPVPTPPRQVDPNAIRRNHRVDKDGNISFQGHVIRIGAQYPNRTVQVICRAGDHLEIQYRHQQIRTLVLDRTRKYQPSGLKRGGPPKPPPD
jgi:transposase InsO family protein